MRRVGCNGIIDETKVRDRDDKLRLSPSLQLCLTTTCAFDLLSRVAHI